MKISLPSRVEGSSQEVMNIQPEPLRPRHRYWWALRILVGTLVLVLALGAVTGIAGASAKSNLTKKHRAPGLLVDVGGYQMHIQCIGQGSPTIILEAGLDDFSIFWSRVQPGVAGFASVCSYDRAGYGWSQVSPHPRTGETMVRELHTLLANAGVEEPYVLVGHSIGGALVRKYAHTYPDEVTGLVLVDAAHAELFTRVPIWRQAVAQIVGMYQILAPLNSVGLLALAPESIPDRGLPEGTMAQYRAIAATSHYFDTAIAEKEAFESILAQVRVADTAGFGNLPLIVISSGIWDPLPGLSTVENEHARQAWQAMQSDLVTLSANSKRVVAEQSGHLIQLQQPELVIDAIREMVEATGK